MILKLLSQIFYSVIILCLVLFSLGAASHLLRLPNGIRLYTVQSGSMEKAIHTGSIVIVHPQDSYSQNDVITFKSPEDKDNPTPKSTTTHRLVEIISQDNATSFRTKGDANDAPDSTLVDPSLVVGKVIFSLPYVGFPIAFARTQTGLIVLIIIPATIIVYSELLNIKSEISKYLNRRKSKPTHETSTT